MNRALETSEALLRNPFTAAPAERGGVAETLLERIRAKEARVGVIGLGYVGLPLAVEFAHAGFTVTGFDVDSSKADADQRRQELHSRRPGSGRRCLGEERQARAPRPT